jgi:superfamily II DNA or RNA helicase
MFSLRPYQDACLRAIDAGWAESERQLVVLPTGAGKTIIFSALAHRYLPRKTLILAHREELIEQAAAKLAASTGIRAEVEKAERRASFTAPVVVASVQTLMQQQRRQRWHPHHFGLIVCDEAHHSVSASWQSVLNHFQSRVLGVTATPDRSDKKELGNFYERLAYECTLVDLIRGGYLCPISLRAVPLKIDIRQVQSTAGDLDAQQLGDALEPYLADIAAAVKEHAGGRRTLAFLPLIATSIKFAAACRTVGLKAEHVDGYDQQRALKLSNFACCEYDVLTNAMLLTEGYDDPGIECIVMLRPTKSRALYAQAIGRGTRVHPLKSDLLILDFLWLHERHRLSRAASLVASTEEEAEAMTKVSEESSGESQDLLDIQCSAVAEREESLRKKLVEQASKKAKYLSADEWAAQHDRMTIAEYEPTFQWEQKPVSTKQARVLKRAGIDVATVRGAGHASQLIGAVLGNAAVQACTPAQKFLLKRLGHQSPETATVGEFRSFMGRMKKTK